MGANRAACCHRRSFERHVIAWCDWLRDTLSDGIAS
jgi:hypothetical protein